MKTAAFKPGSLLALGCFFLFSFQLFAEDYHIEAIVDKSPYVPQVREYSLEVGVFNSQETMYWIGGQFGVYLGDCFFMGNPHCSQYIDFIGGGGGNGNENQQLALTGLRWQFVNVPSSWSPSLRVLAGASHSTFDGVTRTRPTAAIGIGVSRYLHRNLDVHFEARGGVDYKPYSQFIIGFHIKVDRWVSPFVKELRDLGIDTFNSTVDVIKKPFEGGSQSKGGQD